MATVTGVATLAMGATAAEATTSGTAYYVDCVGGNDAASGTAPNRAWKSLNRVNQVTYRPGDSISLRRGTTCTGVLQPKGSGTPGSPIKLGAYGSGARPKIVGTGGRATVLLRNVQGWQIRDLEITNPGPADGTPRVGIYVQLENYGIGRSYLIENVYVHDVPGCDCLDPTLENSGGILFEALGTTTPTGFDGIKVLCNQVSGVDNIGIGTLSLWSRRDLYPGGQNSFVPITNVRVAGNQLSNLGGDGILLMNTIDGLTEDNKVAGFGLRATQSHAAVLAYNSDRTIMQRNEITGGAAFPPSFSFSVDAATKDIVYQYNYSHDNNGPFVLYCAPTGTFSDGAIIRYNISENDKDVDLGGFIIPVIAAGCDNAVTNSKFYNNTVHAPNAANMVGTLPPFTSIAFTNNIFAGRAEGSTIQDPAGVYSHNLYHNIGPNTVSDNGAVVADPRFVNPPGPQPAGLRLRCDSPAIDTGTPIANNGGRDYFGNPVSATANPNIGAYEGPCVS
ncbi:hypothetical protein [Micromonospora sp. RTGN7]|uniref:hypothetical protein n=1 Tax=Micromonospora sp. RTGN7 TaxID=3016526 RepID=UPI0029FEE1AB|nr:hypothetical protein [Micromonospora sp. RTGN7]